MKLFKSLVFIGLLAIGFSAAGQQPAGSDSETANTGPNPRGYSVGLFTGSLLPNKVSGVRELLPHWGFRLGHPFRNTQLEYNFAMANAKGKTYQLGFVSLRNPVEIPALIFHWIVGVDVHRYKQSPTSGFRQSAGWHAGFGARFELTGGVSFRTDFRQGFSPGQQLLIMLGMEKIF